MSDCKPVLNKVILARITHFLPVAFIILFIAPDINCQPNGNIHPFGDGITAQRFYASAVGDNNTVWFLTESGMISFDGTNWTLVEGNSKINTTNKKNLTFVTNGNKSELWLAGADGATMVTTPVNAESEIVNYIPDNSKIVSKDVLAVVTGKKATRWFGTNNGVSAMENGKWLTNDYEERYPSDVFQYFPFSAMAASNSGDSLYVGTLGGGVMRFYKNDVDAISGASEFAIWGPIEMPSDSVFSVYVAPDGSQWIGTDQGVAKHTGHNALEGWTIYDVKSGLADNKVQAINSDSKGNFYFGTKSGLSVLNGTNFRNYKIVNGLASNNILTIAVDKNNVVWLGTDNGVTRINNGELTSFR